MLSGFELYPRWVPLSELELQVIFPWAPLIRVIGPLSWRHEAIGLVTQQCWQY